MNKLALAAIATAALGALAILPAYAGADGSGGDGVDSFQIVVVDAADAELNGPQLTGIALHSLNSNQPVVTAVTLPSGATVHLRHL